MATIKTEVQVKINTGNSKQDLADINKQLDDIQESSKIDIAINNADNIKSVGDLKAAYKELVSIQLEYGEGTEEFTRAAKKAGELKDQLGAVNDSVKSFSNSPVENLSAAFSDLKTKVVNLDFAGLKQSVSNFGTAAIDAGKSVLGIGQGLTTAQIAARGFGLALAATGIPLFVAAIVALISNFDTLKNSGGLLGNALTAIGDTVKKVTTFVTDLAIAWGIVGKESTQAARDAKKAAEDAEKSLDAIRKKVFNDNLSELDRAIQVEKDKRQEQFALFIDDIKQRERQGKLSREQSFAENQAFIAQTESNIQAIRDKFAVEELEKERIKQAELQRVRDEALRERLRNEAPEAIEVIKVTEVEVVKTNNEEIIESEFDKAERLGALAESVAIRNRALREQELAEVKATEDQKQQYRQYTLDASFNAASNFTSAVGQLTQTMFNNDLAAAKGNAVEEEKIRKKAFAANKALSIVSATISTAQAVIAAYRAGSEIPFAGITLGPIMAAAAAVAGAIQIGAISATQYSPTGGGVRSTPKPPPIPNVSAAQQPVASFAAAGTAASTTVVGEGSQTFNVNASVSVTEINQAQNQVGVYQSGSQLGGSGTGGG